MQGRDRENQGKDVPEIDEIFQLNRCKLQKMCDEIVARECNGTGNQTTDTFDGKTCPMKKK
ncbi:MAG TPA: hypothetical protein VN611_09150 [Patescibacteria group bacterium]|nr:hypothetical protein [Patescibacteria group bacterium]